MSYRRSHLRYRVIRDVIGFAAAALILQTVRPQTGMAQSSAQRFSLSRLEIMALEGGRIVAKTLKTSDSREATVIGAVHIRVPMDTLAEYCRDVEAMSCGGKIVTQAGKFSASPSPSDLEDLELPEQDLRDLRDCRVGRCNVKLTRRQIEMLQDLIDWSHADRERQVAMVLGRSLIARLDAYLSEGNAALPVYHDKDDPLDSAEDFRAVVSQSGKFLAHDPVLYRYLQTFPDVEASGIDELYYWAVEDYTLKPVITLNHMMISRRATGDLSYTTIAIKRIYTSHYLQSLLELAVLTPASDRYPLRGTHLVLHVHMRFDGPVGGIKRALLERKLEHLWALHLKALRERAEERYLAGRGP